MKIVILATTAAITLAACVPVPPTCGLPNEPVVISYAKGGLPIYDDQVPLSGPCPEVVASNGLSSIVSQPPVVRPPVEPPVPPIEPPVEPPKPPKPPEPPKPPKVKGNNGHGNLDDPAPGNSGSHNNAENSDNSGIGNSGNGKGGKSFSPPNNN